MLAVDPVLLDPDPAALHPERQQLPAAQSLQVRRRDGVAQREAHQRLAQRDALQLPAAGGQRVVRPVAVVVPARRSGLGGSLLAVAAAIGKAAVRAYVLLSFESLVW